MVARADERRPQGDALEHLVEHQGCGQGADGAGRGRHPESDADDDGVGRDAILQHLGHRYRSAACPDLRMMHARSVRAMSLSAEAEADLAGTMHGARHWQGTTLQQPAFSTCVSPEAMELASPDSISAGSSTVLAYCGGGMSCTDRVILQTYVGRSHTHCNEHSQGHATTPQPAISWISMPW
jgi:hypothetical protein